MNKAHLLKQPAHLIALGFGAGLSPVAPGTSGTLWAWAMFLLLQLFLTSFQFGILLFMAWLIGWWACTKSAELLGVTDPGMIVWDEVVAFWLILWVLSPASWLMQLIAFVLFRFFDAAKPGPVGWADQVFKGSGWRGGWGILFDDLVAAFCTLLLMALGRIFDEQF
jgi:phosphatidylglycerophosphatase A